MAKTEIPKRSFEIEAIVIKTLDYKHIKTVYFFSNLKAPNRVKFAAKKSTVLSVGLFTDAIYLLNRYFY